MITDFFNPLAGCCPPVLQVRWRGCRTEKPLIMTPSSLFFNEKFSSLVLSKPSASSVLNGTSVLVNEFDIVILIEELVPLFVYHSYNMISALIIMNTEISLCCRKIVTKWCVINLRSCCAMFVMGENRFHRTHDCIWLSLANESFLVICL